MPKGTRSKTDRAPCSRGQELLEKDPPAGGTPSPAQLRRLWLQKRSRKHRAPHLRYCTRLSLLLPPAPPTPWLDKSPHL